MHIMSILCSSADAISSGSCPILFKVLTLNVAICSVCLHFSSFDCLSSVADFEPWPWCSKKHSFATIYLQQIHH